MVRFTKMEGLGNDYIYVNNLAERLPEERLSALAVLVSDRHFGVGADGLIVILPPTEAGHDFRFRMFNADGSEGEMCGNGMRCFARYCYDRGLTAKTTLRVQTLAGTIIPRLNLDEKGQVASVTVDMGEPRLLRGEFPMVGAAGERVLDEPFSLAGREYRITAVRMGVPHLVIYTDDVDAVDLAAVGPLFESHPAFPQRTNVNFVQVISSSELRMRTWERGSGITLACGTGASAVLVASHLSGRSGRDARIHLPGGDLTAAWDETSNHVYMTGPAAFVCDGTFLRPF